MARIITFTNQKGGVGKTSLALNFGVKLRMEGARVLMVDMDPQCSLSYSLGADDPKSTVMEVMTGYVDTRDAIVKAEECDILCASPRMSTADITLTGVGKEYILREALEKVKSDYDYIIIDSPPTLGILTINILTAANDVMIPALADIFSLQGIGQLYSSISAVQKYCNPSLKVVGIILSRNTERLLLNRDLHRAMEQTADQLQTRLFKASIRESVTVREAQARRQSIFRYAPKSRQAADYEQVVGEYLACSGK